MASSSATALHPSSSSSASLVSPQSFAPPSTIPRLTSSIPCSPASQQSPAFSNDGRHRKQVEVSLADLKPLFSRVVKVMALRVPVKQVTPIKSSPLMAESVLIVPKMSSIARDPAPEHAASRLILLRYPSQQQIPDQVASFAQERGLDIIPYEIPVTYDWYSADEVLSRLLPEDPSQGTPTSFTTVGHIAHLNLRDEYLPFRFLIGQVILEKNPNTIRTVVNKLDSIDAEFRFFQMELLAGEEDYITTACESNCSFTFDFRKVYFNSRLHTEHNRIVSLMRPGEIVSDVMAGVGPFAVPAAKAGCIVYANDLNPASYESLIGNAKRNKVEGGCKCYCEDGRFFIRESIKRVWRREILGWAGPKKSKELAKLERAKRMAGQEEQSTSTSLASSSTLPPPSRLVDHFIMNLPASALEFLDAYRGAYRELAEEIGRDALEAEIEAKKKESRKDPNKVNSEWPMVHVHCFTKEMDRPFEDICQRANRALGLSQNHPDRLVPPAVEDPSVVVTTTSTTESTSIPTSTPSSEISLHWVRKVAPNKDMYCLSFRLPRSVLFDE